MTAHSALYYTVKVAGGGPSVHACAVFLRAESRDGDKLGQTPYHGTGDDHSTQRSKAAACAAHLAHLPLALGAVLGAARFPAEASRLARPRIVFACSWLGLG